MIVKLASGVLDLTEKTVEFLSGLALILVTGVIFLNALGRYLFSFSLLGGEEFARLLTVYICFLTAFTLVRRDGHVSVDILNRLVSERMQRVLRGLVALVGIVLMAYLAVASWQLVGFSAATGQQSTTLPVPRYFFFLPLAIGASLMTLAYLETLIRAITNTLRPLPALDVPPPPEKPSARPAAQANK